MRILVNTMPCVFLWLMTSITVIVQQCTQDLIVMVSEALCPIAGQLVSDVYIYMASDLYNCDCPAMYTGLNCDGK
jgi:hypothetical protein